jgi:hypothetical protein
MVLQIAPLRLDMLAWHTPVEFEAQEVTAFKHLHRTAVPVPLMHRGPW